MRKKLLSIILLSIALTNLNAQSLITAGAAGQDYGKDIEIDQQGNIVSAGYFYNTVDFDPSGITNNKTSVGNADNYIAKYNNTGGLLWAISYGSLGVDIPHSVVTDLNNNIIVCGYFSGICDFDPSASVTNKTSNGGRDAYIAKYDENGNFQWVVTYGSDSLDDAFNLDVDALGNIYWTGVIEGTVTVGTTTYTTQVEDIVFGKINSAGVIQWTKSVGGTGTDEGSGIIIDNNGDIIHTGYFQTTVDFDPNAGVNNVTSVGSYDTYFGKYDTNGNLIWIKKIGGVGADIGAPGGITIDNLNNFYIAGNAGANCDYDPNAGTVTHTMNGTTDWFVAKYDNSGNHILSFTVGGTGQDQAHRLTTDNQQNIYVTGWFRTSANFNPNGAAITLTGNCTGGGHDGYVAKYNSSGICLWAKQFGGVVAGATELTLGTSIKLLNQQQIVFSGRFHGTNAFANIPFVPTATSNGSSDIFICMLDSAGNYQNTLPLRLLNFSGVLKDNNAILNWKTENEINTSHFAIEKSLDGISFEKIGEVKSFSNSNTVNSYSFIDKGVTTKSILYYRLKQIDIDGKFTYSKILALKVANENNQLINIYPNPSKNILRIDATDNNIKSYKIINSLGVTISSLNIYHQIDISNLPIGIYYINFYSQNNLLIETKTFIKE